MSRKGVNNYKQVQGNKLPNLGLLLKTHLQNKKLTKSEVARTLSRTNSTVAGLLKKESFQTAILWEFCFALQHNFFADLAVQLPETFAAQPPGEELVSNPFQTRVADLEKQNAELEFKVKTLKEALELVGRK